MLMRLGAADEEVDLAAFGELELAGSVSVRPSPTSATLKPRPVERCRRRIVRRG
jgi:hypothetical protein